MPFLTDKQLDEIGFKSMGKNVLISDKVSIYNPGVISIGSNVRIDDFVILSAGEGISIGNFIHIAPYSSFIGLGRIVLDDFVSISGRVSIYSSTDDYMGLGMTNPMVPEKFRRVTHGKIHLKKHVIVGAGSVIMPGIVLETGAAISALTLVNKNCSAFTIYRGVPAVEVGKRMNNILKLEEKFYAESN